MKRLMVVALTLMVMLCFGAISFAGSLDDTGSPTTNGGGAMNTLKDIYNILNDGTTNAPRTVTFTEPSAGPASTGHTLTEVYDRAKTSSRPAKTGQTTSYATGDDGDLQKGVAWPAPRFTDNGNGTVTDNLTGLMWTKDASPEAGGVGVEKVNWETALNYCNGLTLGEYTDWRLPNVKELQSLIDWTYYNPALSNAAGTAKWTDGDAFSDVQSRGYWSSTTYAYNTANAWFVGLRNGSVNDDDRGIGNYVWPVRGGQQLIED